jgi:hypothetical protein
VSTTIQTSVGQCTGECTKKSGERNWKYQWIVCNMLEIYRKLLFGIELITSIVF